ncbi:alcohol dehydrogenase catalytic domain-containing protein [Alcaligenaceae bacterium]|nr:alcohol dehydrogenase catalytic domain-containing protein [Alcaligenaceae bacterium]
MRCQCLVDFGEALRADEREPLVPNGTEVIVRIVAAGVCHSDLHIHEGGFDLGRGKRLSYKERGLKLPLILGHEPVGVIEAMGPGAGKLDTNCNYIVYPWTGCGECQHCSIGNEHYCAKPRAMGVHIDGAYATHMRVPHPRYLFDIGSIEPAHAAPLACSGLTAYSALKKVESTLKKTPVVIIGAGGLGLMAVQLAIAMGGLAPIVVDIDPKKRTAALAAGACAAIDSAADDAVAQIHAAAGTPPDAAIDFVGAEATAELGFNAVERAGTLVIVGLYGGAAPWALPLIPIKAINIRGTYTGSLNEFRELMAIAAQGIIPPLPTTTYPLEEAQAVLDRLKQGEVVGRAVLIP